MHPKRRSNLTRSTEKLSQLCLSEWDSLFSLVLWSWKEPFCVSIQYIIIWLAPRAGKMNQIARCDWLPERARWSHLARSGLPAVSRMKSFPESHIINPLLTKFVRSRWLDIYHTLLCTLFCRELDSVKEQLRKSEGEVSYVLWSMSQQVIMGRCRSFNLPEVVSWRY